MHKSGEPIQTYLHRSDQATVGRYVRAGRLTSSAKARRAQRTVQDVGARKARMTAPQMPPARGRMTVPQKAATASRKLVRRRAKCIDGGAEFAEALFEGAHGLGRVLVLGGPLRSASPKPLLDRGQAVARVRPRTGLPGAAAANWVRRSSDCSGSCRVLPMQLKECRHRVRSTHGSKGLEM